MFFIKLFTVPAAAGLSRDRNFFFPSRSDSATISDPQDNIHLAGSHLQPVSAEIGTFFFRAEATRLQLAILKTTFILPVHICSRSQQRPELITILNPVFMVNCFRQGWSTPPYSCWCCKQRWTIDLQLFCRVASPPLC